MTVQQTDKPLSMVERLIDVIQDVGPVGCCNIDDKTAMAIAVATLQALREPTEAMLGAFDRMCDDNGQCLVKSGYRAMIDAALSEGAER